MEWPWPKPLSDGAADHLVPGLALPDVLCRTTDNRDLSLARLEGRFVVVIYPWTGQPGVENPPGWDETPGAHGSTPELEGFARLHHGFKDVKTDIVGLSGQTAHEQAAFANRLRLPYPLLSDATGALRQALQLPTFETGGETYLCRLTLVIRDGKIERVYYPVHPPDAHAREVLYFVGGTRPNANSGR